MLTAPDVRHAKARERTIRLADAHGLSLVVRPTGGKWWRFDYRIHGKRKTISLGTYPDVPLAKARERLQTVRSLVADGVDPSRERQQRKRAELGDTFRALIAEWQARQAPAWAPKTIARAKRHFALLPATLTALPIARVEPPDILEALREIERAGHHDTAHRVKQRCSQVFRYAIATGRATRDAAADLKGALTPVRTTHRAALTAPGDVGALLRTLDAYEGHVGTRYALRLLPLLFVRPGELRHAEWNEFVLQGPEPEWRVPAQKMKMHDAHVVPLATQAASLLLELRQVNGPDGYLFPSLRTRKRPLSDNTLNAALRRMGYSSTEMTAHGFRAIASTRLHELGWAPDVIERQLAHRERNKVRAAYHRAQYLDERRKMMQAWADHLDELRQAADTRQGGLAPS